MRRSATAQIAQIGYNIIYFMRLTVWRFEYNSSTMDTEDQEPLDPKQCFKKKCTNVNKFLIYRQ